MILGDSALIFEHLQLTVLLNIWFSGEGVIVPVPTTNVCFFLPHTCLRISKTEPITTIIIPTILPLKFRQYPALRKTHQVKDTQFTQIYQPPSKKKPKAK